MALGKQPEESDWWKSLTLEERLQEMTMARDACQRQIVRWSRKFEELHEAVKEVLAARNPPKTMTGPEVCDHLRDLLRAAIGSDEDGNNIK